ncbi:MAG: VOC family protein [Salinigranum sp.]
MAFLHTAINVADADESVAFYEQFGFEESTSFFKDGGKTENRYVADDEGVELQFVDTEGDEEFEQGTAWNHLAVEVDDVDAALEEIEHYGLDEGPTDVEPVSARVAFVRDPDGHSVELVQKLE